MQIFGDEKDDETQKYHLKTRLLTWDDVEDDDLDVGQCLLDDDEVYKLIQDQKDTVNSTRNKDKIIEEMYRKAQGPESKYTDYKEKVVSRFKVDNQSVVNSTESFH